MTINELYKFLGAIFEPVEEDTGTYSFTLKTSNDYDKLYSKLDSSDIFNLSDTDFVLTAEESKMLFFNDDFNIELEANFTDDTYKVTIYEVR